MLFLVKQTEKERIFEMSYIVYEPTERQAYFHSQSDDYIVLGGSRGSGVPAPV